VASRLEEKPASDEARLQSLPFIRGVWLHPDGKRMVYTRNELNHDIWMLEGLPRPETDWRRIFTGHSHRHILFCAPVAANHAWHTRRAAS
jgi:hypothetical protein